MAEMKLRPGKSAMTQSFPPRLLAALFVALALPLGLLMVHLVPLGQVVDETAHVLKADSLMHGEWIGHRKMLPSPGGRLHLHDGVDADQGLLDVVLLMPRPFDTTPTRIDASVLARSSTVPFGKFSFSDLGTIASYFPVFYLPAAGALGATKAIGLGARTAFLNARLANLLVAMSIGAASLLLARRGAVALFAMLLLPTSMGLMASVNQDGLLIATSALAAALTTRIVADISPWRQPCYLGAAVLVGCICLAKPPYLPMTALLLLPIGTPRRRMLPGWLPERLAAIGLVLLLTLLWTWANIHYAAVPWFNEPAEAGPLWAGPRPAIFDGTDMTAQLHVLLAKPWRLIWLPIHSILKNPVIFRQVVDDLGWLNMSLAVWLVALWTSVLILALASGAAASWRRSGHHVEAGVETALLGVAVLTTIILIYLSQYLSFTPVGWDWIAGPQGRYLLPLLPMLSLAILPSSNRTASPNGVVLLATAVAALASLWVIPFRIVGFYYIGAS